MNAVRTLGTRSTRPARLAFLVPVLLLVLAVPPVQAGQIDAGVAHWIGLGPQIQKLAPSAPGAPSPLPLAMRAPVGADGRIQCWVTCSGEGVDAASWGRALNGLQIEGQVGAAVQVRLPLSQVRALADLPQVLYVGLPPRPVPLVESEGLDSMRVKEFWSLNRRGDGVRIGILDVGFQGYETLLGTELPSQVHARAFYHNSSTGALDITGDGEIHGTACAEVVHDVAPDAELYLANAGTPAELQQAEQWMVDQGVEVISHSVGWFFGPGDGTGVIDGIAAAASDAGVLWVNAAGNFAQSCWSGRYRDANGDKVAEVNDSGEESIALGSTYANDVVEVILLWNRWPTSPDLDFEMDLLNGRQVIATSEQGPPDVYAIRQVDLQVPAPMDSLRVRVRWVSGDTTGARLRLIRTDGNLAVKYQTPDGSLAMPADAPSVLAVGAYRAAGGFLESFSSRGPTTDGRSKPEILGPDCVQTYSYHQLGPFCGTSAATPHVAGAVGLILSSAPQGALFDSRWALSDVLRLLQIEARPPTGESDPSGIGWDACACRSRAPPPTGIRWPRPTTGTARCACGSFPGPRRPGSCGSSM